MTRVDVLSLLTKNDDQDDCEPLGTEYAANYHIKCLWFKIINSHPPMAKITYEKIVLGPSGRDLMY